MLHTLHAKENGAKVIVVDPRFTRTAAKADKYYRIRSGADVAFLFGHALPHLQERLGRQGVHQGRASTAWTRSAKRSAKWTPDKVEEVTGDERSGSARRRRDAWPRTARARSSGRWARRSTPTATPSCARPASCSSRSATSASPGGGCNIYRGHDNVQGATDVGPNPDSLPGYYGLADRRVEALGARSGASTTNGSRSSSRRRR